MFPSNSSFDTGGGLYAAEHFPEEIWDGILGKLSRPEDINASSQVCTTFNRILKPQRTASLFLDVFEQLHEYMDKSSILNCRLVSRTWKRAVDWVGYTSEKWDWLTDTFRSSRSLTTFKSRMASHSMDDNPFISREVTFEDFMEEGDEAIRNFWKNAIDMCEKFGAHIWKVSFHIGVLEFEELPFLHMYQLVAKLMELMPSLRRIYFFRDVEWSYVNDDGNEEQLMEIIREVKIPRMPFMDALWIPVFPAVCMERILEAMKSSLTFLYIEEGTFGDYRLELRGIGEMKCLQVLIIVPMVTVELITSLHHLNLQDQLIELELFVICRNALELSGLIYNLNFFRNLYQLDLTIKYGGRDGNLYENGKLSKPSFSLDLLKSLSLKVRYVGTPHTVSVTGFDFMGFLPCLEEFKLEVVKCGIRPTRNPKERVEISGYRNRLGTSNIWELFPELDQVRLKDGGPERIERFYKRNEI